jgi:hypothetical protein
MSNRRSGAIRSGRFRKQLSNCKLLKKGPALCIYLCCKLLLKLPIIFVFECFQAIRADTWPFIFFLSYVIWFFFWLYAMVQTYQHLIFYNYLIPQSTNLSQMTVAWLVRKFLPFMEYEDSLPCLQGSATGPSPEPTESSPCPHTPFH